MKATIRGIQVEGTAEEVTKLIREFEPVVGGTKATPYWMQRTAPQIPLMPCDPLYPYPYLYPGVTYKADSIK